MILIALLALLLRIYGIKFNLPYFIIQPDEEQIVVRALRFGYGDLNPHWFLYPTLYLYLTFFLYAVYFAIGSVFGVFGSAADFGLAFFRDPTVFYLLPRLLSALLGAATVLCVYFAAKKLFDNERYGLFSALFLSVSLFHVTYSHLAKPDITMLFFLMLGFSFAVLYYKEGRRTWSLLAGLFAGLAVSTKYPAGMIVVPLILAHVFTDRQRPRRRLSDLAVSLGLMASGFIAGSPYALLDGAFYGWLGQLHDYRSTIWRGQQYAGITGYKYYLFYAWPESSGLLLFLASIGGLALVFKKNLKEGLLLAAFPLCYWLYMGRSSLFLSNYFIPCVPFLLMFAGAFAGELSGRLKKGWVKAGFVLALILPSLVTVLGQLHLFTTLNTAVVAKLWIEKNIPAGSKIVSLRGGPPLNLTKERAGEILSEGTPAPEFATGPSVPDTGRGAYYKYLLENTRQPAYYYVVLPRSGGGPANLLKDFDLELYKDYDYVVLASVLPAKGSAAAGPPITVPQEMAKGGDEQFGGYYKFLEDVGRKCALLAEIDGKYQDAGVEKSFPESGWLFKLYGRPGPMIKIYKINRERLSKNRL